MSILMIIWENSHCSAYWQRIGGSGRGWIQYTNFLVIDEEWVNVGVHRVRQSYSSVPGLLEVSLTLHSSADKLIMFTYTLPSKY